MRYGRIYDDLWPENIAGYYCAEMTALVKDKLDARYPGGWEANTHMLLMTQHYPYLGQWHHDAPPYEDDTIVLICLAGHDELEFYDSSYPLLQKYVLPYVQSADLYPGQSLLLPASLPHRGRCTTYRITYHCRAGPKGRIMPESPMDKLPPMTARRFFGRTWRTLKYWLR